MDISIIVNWIEKIVFNITCHRQLKQLRVVLEYRRFIFVEKKHKKADVAVSAVCSAFIFIEQSTVPADII